MRQRIPRKPQALTGSVVERRVVPAASCCVDADEALGRGVASLAHIRRVTVLLATPSSRLMERFCIDDNSLAAACPVQIAWKRVSLVAG